MKVRGWMARRIRGRSELEADVYVVSYPKCGRTWLRVLVGAALCRQFQLDEGLLFKTVELSAAAEILPTKFIHDGTGGVDGVRWSEQDRDKSRFAGKKVALLVRDPRDVIVSSYYQATRRMHVYAGSLAEFIRDECFGIRTVAAMYSAWQAGRDVPRDFLLLRYEEMHDDPEASLRSLLGFMGLASPDEAAVAHALRFGSFENMQALEESGRFSGLLRPGDPEDSESFKVRRGKVGGFADYLSPEDIAYVDSVLTAQGRPFGFGEPTSSD